MTVFNIYIVIPQNKTKKTLRCKRTHNHMITTHKKNTKKQRCSPFIPKNPSVLLKQDEDANLKQKLK